uniref:Uncharacterized protein n=1 Tax=Glossina palpalis gambiensis TaxID=67801 RepID=A0A1B0B5I3_9MUSC
MANMAVSRIKREFKEVMRSEEIVQCSIKIELVNDSWTELRGEIAGPPDTPYEGGKFVLEIKVPETYPFNPPKVRFVTRIWHPNISSVTGAICLDILKDNWKKCSRILGNACTHQDIHSSILQDIKLNEPRYCGCKRNTTFYPIGGETIFKSPHRYPDCDAKIQRLQDMGINEHDARAVLSKENWDLEKASESLFS